MDNQKEGFPKVLNLLLWKTMQMENTCQILNWKVITSSHLSSNVKNCIYLPIDSEMSLWWNGKHELNDHEGQGFSLLLESVKRKNKCSINTARCITSYLHGRIDHLYSHTNSSPPQPAMSSTDHLYSQFFHCLGRSAVSQVKCKLDKKSKTNNAEFPGTLPYISCDRRLPAI